MRRILFAAALLLLTCPYIGLADTDDTAQFSVRMLPSNEVPAITAPGVSGEGVVTIRVTRDGRGLINAATVIFEVNYVMATSSTTFTGLHLHNAPAGTNGPVVIDSGISAANPVIATAATGRIVRITNYSSADTAGLRFVSGLLDMPHLYYINLHTTTNPGGLIRAQLTRNKVTFRTYMSPANEVPALSVDAEGGATITVVVNRDANGAITSGTVSFDIDYRFGAAANISGLHIHNAPAGVNGGVVIDTGINGTTRSIPNATRGNVFRVAEIDSANAGGIAALNGLMTDPTQYYVNMHTTVNPGGVIRGQLDPNVQAFFGRMTGAEENPAVNTPVAANSVTLVRADRDGTGNVTGGLVSFNVAYDLGGTTQTFTGWHIHNGNFGVNGGVVINTGIGGANPVVGSPQGTLNRDVTIDSSNQVALDALRGLLANPEAYYVNLHTTTFGGGIVRAQLAREIYRYRTVMSPANEVPAITSNAAGMGWLSVKINRDANGAITGGSTTFDITYDLAGAATITGLHIHNGPAGINGPVVINTGIGAANPVDSPTGIGNITRVVDTDATTAQFLNQVITSPESAYVNLHTTVSPGGLIRAQLLPMVNYVPVLAGGGDWISSTTIRNNGTSAVQGQFVTVRADGSPFPADISDANISFWIPAGGSVAFNQHNRGDLTAGYGRVHSNGPVVVDSGFTYDGLPSMGRSTAVTARAVSIPVNTGSSAGSDTGVAILPLTAGTVNLTLRVGGFLVTSFNRSVPVGANQPIIAFVRELFSGLPQGAFTGTLIAEMQPATGTGSLSAIALQFGSSVDAVTITPQP